MTEFIQLCLDSTVGHWQLRYIYFLNLWNESQLRMLDELLLLLFSRSVVSNSLQRHGQQRTRLSCPSPSPGVSSNSCPLSQWCYPTILSSQPLLLLPLIFPSSRIFSKESALHSRWPKYWSFSISHSNEESRLISSRMDWFDLLLVQGTLKSLQHHNPKASILQHHQVKMRWN